MKTAAVVLAAGFAITTPAAPAVPVVPVAPVSIPFELATRHIVIPLRVNNSRPLSFVLDTGANNAIIRLDVAKELGLSLYGSVNLGGAGANVQRGSMVKDATWTVPGLDGFRRPLTLALPLPALSPGMGRAIDGIIGAQLIREFVVEIDYQARRLTFHDRDTFTYTGNGQAVPIEFTGEMHPIVPGSIAPHKGGPSIAGRFLFDIGSGGTLVVHSPTVEKYNLLGEGSAPTVRLIGAGGAGGRTNGRIGRMASLQIGPFAFREPIVMFSQDKAGSFANATMTGNIGAQIASRFRLFLDYGRRRIILEPVAGLDAPFERAFSGIAVRAFGDDYRTFRVVEVLETSPATDAGIEVDDVITAVDGKPATELTLSTLNELFEQERTYELTIRRGSKTIAVRLTPRKMI